jgi:hypothetical protein
MNLLLRSLKTGLIVLGLLTFVPAGTFDYWRGWAFIIVYGCFSIDTLQRVNTHVEE